MKKTILLFTVGTLLVLIFWIDLDQYLTLAYLKTHRDALIVLQNERPWLVALGYCGLYVGVTALSLPGATIMTLAGGALFGFWLGLLLISFASSMGATAAFLVARHLLRDVVQRRLGDRLAVVHAGIEKEGALYLFTLRMVPVVPFFLVNVLMALTPIRTMTYHWVSQVGMLAATVVYVNAGTQLAHMEGLSDIVSPAVLLSFTLLGLFPWLTRYLQRWYVRVRRAGDDSLS